MPRSCRNLGCSIAVIWTFLVSIYTMKEVPRTTSNDSLDILSTLFDLSNGTSTGESSCRRMSCSVYSLSRTCYCDSSCSLFGDCCLDVPSNISAAEVSNETAMPDSDVHMSNDHSIHLMKRFGSCQKFSNVKFYLVIDSCPLEFHNTQLSRGCSERRRFKLRNIAVSVGKTNETQIVFLNSDCAKCHGYNNEDIVPWDAQLHCLEPIRQDESEEDIAERCSVLLYPPTNLPHPRQCVVTNVSTCPADFSDQNITQKCQTYGDAVYHQNVTSLLYKNEYCASCNGVDKNQTQPWQCQKYFWSSTIDSNGIYGKVSLIYFFSFGNDIMTLQSSFGTQVYIPSCEAGKGYFTMLRRCLEISCPSNYRLRDSECILKYPPVNSLVDYGTDLLPKLYLTLHVHHTEEAISNQSVILQIQSNCSLDFVQREKNSSSSSSTLIFDLAQIGMNNTINNVIDCVLSLLYTLDEMAYISVNIQNYIQFNNNLCPQGVLRKQGANILVDLSVNDIGHIFNQSVNINNSNVSFRLLQLGFQIEIDKNHMQNTTLAKVFYCSNDLNISEQICSIYFAFNQYELIGDKAVVRDFNDTIEIQSFLIENFTLYACNRLPANSNNSNEYAFTYIYTVCFAASFCSLALVILVYTCLPGLLNLHGKCLISFCLTLALGQLSLILLIYLPQSTCRSFAVISHFLFFAMFMWSGVLAFDLARKLSLCTMMTPRPGNDNRLFVKYSAIAWILPGIIVITCFTADEIHEGNLIGYGKGATGTCWINNGMASLFVFSLPVSAILLINILLLLAVVCGIESARRATKNVKKTKKDICRCLVYTKISLMLGLTWLLGYVAAAVKEQWMYMVYGFVNSLQGVFILLGVLCSQRVMRLLCNKIKSKRNNDSKSVTVESTADTHL